MKCCFNKSLRHGKDLSRILRALVYFSWDPFKQNISGHSQFMPHLDDDITTFPEICQSKHPKETTDRCVHLHADGVFLFALSKYIMQM